jgi:hypothetical protein
MPEALSGEMLTNPVVLTDKGSITASTAESRRSAPNQRAVGATLRSNCTYNHANLRERHGGISPVALKRKHNDTLFGIEREIDGPSVEKRVARRRQKERRPSPRDHVAQCQRPASVFDARTRSWRVWNRGL